ncbi:HAD-IC family P-type ATPase [Actinomadura rupiterrae]|uniref:HAD-IC family P-type ATPase n=1 Tax=Actinomadura rupiterrae TaxID=559627 RepID=UPI0020A2FFC3|nr:HAD-IC family P-type ATPase [Actinomadura rupiterrae]MCP2337078.1 cation-transporting ATPase E [Actinomadura rupiterrae]
MSEVQAGGLTGEQVRERVAAGLVNDVPRPTSRSAADIVRANVLTRFNALIGSLFVLVMVFGEWQDGLFGGIIVANSAIGVVQELRAKRTLDRLAVVGEAPVRVLRDGAVRDLHQQEVVRDDLVVLGAGDKIVVDGPVVSSGGLEVDESLLTGEADPVRKAPGDELQSGSFVVAGSGTFTAAKVGGDAYAARLTEEASRFSLSRSELMDGINRFLKYVTWLIVPTAILLFASQFRSAGGVSNAVVGAVAGVVTMVPEGLVLMTSIAFAVGVVRLGRRQALVQELPAIEGLARVDVLCLDKTGTLTEPGMDLDEVVVLDGDIPGEQALVALARADPDPNATMLAVRDGLDTPDPGWAPAAAVPFSSARKWSGASFEHHGAWVIGAADVLLSPADPARTKAEDLGSSGLRVLALARVPDGAFAEPDELDVASTATPALLVVLRQRIRADAGDTLAYFDKQGVQVKVISGDNPVSVGAIATSLGLKGADHPVDARSLPSDTSAMAEVMDRNSVFGRVTPQQKRDMVAALQSKGHTVAMTGDGVNDVLALKDADLGIAMGSGSDATRAVAQIVLLDDHFSTLPYVVGEGRRVLGNIERVANLFLTKTVYSIILSVLVGLVHVRFPFLPRHLTLISSLTIGVPAFFLALAPNDERARPGFVPRVLRFAIPAGIACGVATFAGYWIATRDTRSSFEQDSSAATISLFLLALWVLVLIARPWNWWRLGLVGAMGAAFAVVLAVPWLRHFFALRPDDLGNDLSALVIAGIAAVLLTLVLKALKQQTITGSTPPRR